MENFTTLIVDDELQSRSLIRKLLSVHFPDLTSDEAEDVATASKKIRQGDYKLIFLDVQMRGETGFDLLDNVAPINFEIIFTTAHSEFALKAFRYSALDYLVKPIDAEDFKSSVKRAIDRIVHNHSSAEQVNFFNDLRSGQKASKLTIPTTEGFLFVNVADILYCHAVGNYTEFYLGGNQKIISSYTLGHYNETLSDQNFFRVHRSYLVNLSHVRMYKKGNGGSIKMSNDEEIEVSRSAKEEFLKALKL